MLIDLATGWRLAGRIAFWAKDQSGEAAKFSMALAWYRPRRSGAYIFDPEPNKEANLEDPSSVSIVRGPMLSEIRQVFPFKFA